MLLTIKVAYNSVMWIDEQFIFRSYNSSFDPFYFDLNSMDEFRHEISATVKYINRRGGAVVIGIK